MGVRSSVQPEFVHGVGEELGVDPAAVIDAVLAGLDPHQSLLGNAAQPRDDPGVRVGLLQLVRRTVHEVLLQLRHRGLVTDELGD